MTRRNSDPARRGGRRRRGRRLLDARPRAQARGGGQARHADRGEADRARGRRGRGRRLREGARRPTAPTTRWSRGSARPCPPTTTSARCWSSSTRRPSARKVDFRTINVGGSGAAPAAAPPGPRRARPRLPRRPRARRRSAPPASRRCRSRSASRAASSSCGKFFNRLDTLRRGPQRGLDVTGRLLLLNSITLTPDATKGFPTLSAEVEREHLPAAAHRGPDRRRDRRRSGRPGTAAAPAASATPRAEHPGHDHDRNHHWSRTMSVLNDTWRFLVQRRLWPVAILLVAAAAAVPMLLAKDPPPAGRRAGRRRQGRQGRGARRPSRSSPRPPTATAAAAATCSARARTRSSRRPPRRRRPSRSRPTAAGTGAPTTPATTGGGSSRDARARSPAPVTGTPVVPRRPKKKYELYELTVRFGASDANRPPRKDVKRLQAAAVQRRARADLPRRARRREDRGVPGRLGRRRPGRRRPAGRRRPPARRSSIREGETEFFDVPATAARSRPTARPQYQLDVVKIHKTTTTDAKQAKKAPPASRRSGRMILRARVAGDGPLRYRYDATTGRLHEARPQGLQGRRRQGRARRAGPLLVSGHRGRRVSTRRPPKLPGVSLRLITAGESPRPRPHLHRRGPARRARARPRGDQRATWRGASSATAAAGA